jgi:hypothetical protein
MTAKLDREARMAVMAMLVDLFDLWRLGPLEQVRLLGLPEDAAGDTLGRLRGGEPPPDEMAFMVHVENLVAIQDCLRTAYPRAGAMAESWLNRPNRHFGQQSPLAVMLEGGLQGLRRVRTHLDCTQNWV